jgi:cell division protein FtsI/penicillin-binding protein 2
MNLQNQKTRLSILGIVLSVLPVLIILMVLRIQVDRVESDRLAEYAEMASKKQPKAPPMRGQIYDRYGHLLASNETMYEVGIDLPTRDKFHESPETLAMTLSSILDDLSYADAYRLASTEFKKFESVHVVVKRFVPQEKHDQLKNYVKNMDADLRIKSLVYEPMQRRVYPENSLAYNILGFVNLDGDGYGVEKYYNGLLTGTATKDFYSINPKYASQKPQIPKGADLVLTIDRRVQLSMEVLLAEAVHDSGSDSGTIVVIEPKTGELIAMATTPQLDLNQLEDLGVLFPDGSFFNQAVSQPYESGSVYKVLTMAAAYDAGAVSDTTFYTDTGVINVGGFPIYNWDRAGHGRQSMQGCMQLSLNVCLAWVATEMGEENFYNYMRAFGIGQLSGVDIAGDNPGRLKVPGDGDWDPFELGTNSFGQGVTATPLQMASAISALANDGKKMAPHVVRSIIIDGFQHDVEIRVDSIPLKPESADWITELLARSLETESSDALVTGYRVAGKTGTAEIAIPGLGYTSNLTNASFVGWGPVDDPQFLVYVWLEKPTTSPWGSVVAAPVFRDAVERLVMLLDIPPDSIRKNLLNGN